MKAETRNQLVKYREFVKRNQLKGLQLLSKKKSTDINDRGK